MRRFNLPTRVEFTELAYRRGLDDAFDVDVVAHVTPYDPGVCQGPVEICYPPEGGDVTFDRIDVICGPGTGAALNPVAVDASDYDAWFSDLETLDVRAFDEARDCE